MSLVIHVLFKKNMNFTKEEKFAIDLAYESGNIMKKHFISNDFGVHYKEDETVVTCVDKEINELVIKECIKKFPLYSVLGEEQSYTLKKDKYVWVVDPIDGTKPFSLGIPIATFSIALVEREAGQPVLAVVYDPFMDRLFVAQKGKNITCNGKIVKVSVDNIGPKMLFCGHGSTIDVMKNFKKVKFTPLTLSSSVYMGMLVATGKVAVYIKSGGSPWDVATIKLIVEEAGGKVTTLSGNSRRYDMEGEGILVSNGIVHEEILSYLN